jgi:DNA replication initiation complex subunit (GINS family)
MITYKDIYEAAKKERYSENLQPIPKSFVKDVAKYLKDKRDVSSKDEDIFSDVLLKTKKQLENAITLFQELLRRRRKKILNLVLIASETGISKQDFDNMLLVEKDLFEELMKCIEISDKKLNLLLNGGEETNFQNNLLVSFTENIDSFVSSEGENYGPYKKGQFANLPSSIAKVFLDDGVAEEM